MIYLLISALAVIVILLFNLRSKLIKTVNEKAELSRMLSQKDREGKVNHDQKIHLVFQIEELKKGIIEKDIFFQEFQEQNNEIYLKLSSLYSDFMLVQYDISNKYLKTKSHPARGEAMRIKELREQTKIYLERLRQIEYKYEYLLNLFPELVNYVDDFEVIKDLGGVSDLTLIGDDLDRTKTYLSHDEYINLPIDERNQLALDRYLKGKKTSWQIGRDYELSCGRGYEIEGWDVQYFGMEQKLDDLGRDLIAIRGNEHLIIQCKYWSKEKTIREKHILQLYGTAIEYGLDKPTHIKIIPVFITSTGLSFRASRFADRLSVEVLENVPMTEIPRIKCNLNKDENGDEMKIYHLPFDQQYDRTKINKQGEFYAYTVEEAVKAGFRRAYKFFG